jgi:flagellar hook-length control protein FliK
LKGGEKELNPVLLSPSAPSSEKCNATGNSKVLPKGINSLFSSLLMPLSLQKGDTKAAPMPTGQTLEGLLKTIKDTLTMENNGNMMTNESNLDLNRAAKAAGINLTDLKTALNDLVKEIANVMDSKNTKLAGLVKSAKSNLTKDHLQDALQNVITMIGAVSVPSILGLDQVKLKTALSMGSNVVHQAENSNLPLNDAKNMIAMKDDLQKLAGKLESFAKPYQKDKQNAILQTAFARINPPDKNQTSNQQPIKGSPVEEGLKNKEAEEGIPNLPSGLMTKIEQYVIHTNKDGEGLNFEQFTKDFSSILGKSQFIKGPASNTLLIKLNPEHLGTLKVELVQQNGSITAKMIASTSTAKDMLDSQLSQLKTAFSQQNIRVDKIDIYFSSGETAGQDPSQEQPSFGQGQEQKQQQQHPQKSSEEFLEALSANLGEEELGGEQNGKYN